MYDRFRVAKLLSHKSLWKEWTSFTIQDVRRVSYNFVHCFQRRFHIRLGYETLSFLFSEQCFQLCLSDEIGGTFLDIDNFSIIPKYIFFDFDNLPIIWKMLIYRLLIIFFDNIAHPYLLPKQGHRKCFQRQSFQKDMVIEGSQRVGHIALHLFSSTQPTSSSTSPLMAASTITTCPSLSHVATASCSSLVSDRRSRYVVDWHSQLSRPSPLGLPHFPFHLPPGQEIALSPIKISCQHCQRCLVNRESEPWRLVTSQTNCSSLGKSSTRENVGIFPNSGTPSECLLNMLLFSQSHLQ